MTATITKSSDRPDVSVPQPLFKTPIEPTYNLDQYAVIRDGSQVLLKVASGIRERSTLTVVLDWPSLLRKE